MREVRLLNKAYHIRAGTCTILLLVSMSETYSWVVVSSMQNGRVCLLSCRGQVPHAL